MFSVVELFDNIYYINQGAAGEEFKAIIADMKVKDGADFATKTYEVRIGGALANDYYVYEITGKALEEIMYGDANSDNKLEAFDASLILQKCAGWDIKINETAADANADGKLEAFDASLVLQKCAGWDIVLGPKAE